MQFILDHSLKILLSLATIVCFLWLLYSKERLGIKWWSAIILAIGHTLIGVFCVLTFAVLETFDLSNFGNMSLFGGVFFMPVFYLAGAKIFHRDIAEVFDVFTPCMIFTVLCARVNCILSGCCSGLQLPGNSGLHWPTRELEILFYIMLLIVIFRKDREAKYKGILYPVYMLSYGIFRFFIEGFRSSSNLGIFHVSHIWAIIAFILGTSIYIEIKNKKKRGKAYAKRNS